AGSSPPRELSLLGHDGIGPRAGSAAASPRSGGMRRRIQERSAKTAAPAVPPAAAPASAATRLVTHASGHRATTKAPQAMAGPTARPGTAKAAASILPGGISKAAEKRSRNKTAHTTMAAKKAGPTPRGP